MTNIFDKFSVKYDAWYDLNRLVYISEIDVLRKVMPKYGKGLEIGVGTGRFAAPLGITLGIDPSAEMLRIASARGVNTRQGFGEDLPFLSETFDYAAIIISLCFVNDPVKVLLESYRVLKKSGRIILGIVDKDSFLGKFYQKKKSVFYKNATFFSVKKVERMLSDSGFQDIKYYQTLFSLPSETTAVDKPRKGYGEGGFVLISGYKRNRN